MNSAQDFPYGEHSAAMAPDPGQNLAAYPAAAGSTQELAQLILMGMQQDIDTRIDWRLQQQPRAKKGMTGQEVGVILGTIGMGIPLTAIAAAGAGLPGIVLIWICLAAINLVWAVRSS